MRKSISTILLALLLGAAALTGTTRLSAQTARDSLSIDGPYILHKGDSVRVITVSEDGVIKDTTYVQAPASFRVCDHEGNYPFEMSLRPIERQNWCVRTAPGRVFVMSDPHGKLDCVISLLQGNGVIDENLHWAYGSDQLVQIGDIFDRGDDAVQIFWFFYRLQQEAADAGGRVTMLMGNHEPMEFSGDMRYATPKYHILARELGIEYRDLFSPDSELGRWIASWNTIGIIGRELYVHAGLSGEFYREDIPIEEVNGEMSNALFMRSMARKAASERLHFLYGSRGPIWYRGMVLNGKRWAPVKNDTLNLILSRYDIDHVIVGHTIFNDVRTFRNGRVICVNVNNARNRDRGLGRALLIEQGRYFVVGDKGKLRELIPCRSRKNRQSRISPAGRQYP